MDIVLPDGSFSWVGLHIVTTIDKGKVLIGYCGRESS